MARFARSNKGRQESQTQPGGNAGASSSKDDKNMQPMASFKQLFSFFEDRRTKVIFAVGCLSAFLNGLVYPTMAYILSNSYSALVGTTSDGLSSDGLAQIRQFAFAFLIVGAFAFIVTTVQTACLEVAGAQTMRTFQTRWFAALLRQDIAYFDLNDVSGLASTIRANSSKVRVGVGLKFGEGLQFLTTFVAGLGYSFYSSWRVALIVMGALPIASMSAVAVMQINRSRSSRASEAYKTAGIVAYGAVSEIRTVLSLNAISDMSRWYSEATLAAFKKGTSLLLKEGFYNGLMIASFLCIFCIVTLFGSMLLYRDVRSTGCDPSAAVAGNETCGESGPSIYGATVGAFFAAMGMSKIANCIEAVTAARVACYPAISVINRTVGSPEQVVAVVTPPSEGKKDDGNTNHGNSGDLNDLEVGKRTSNAILPKYTIDSSSTMGLKPQKVEVEISFKNVHFAYPARPEDPVFSGFNLDIKAGTTVALVGPSGGGKSTAISLRNNTARGTENYHPQN